MTTRQVGISVEGKVTIDADVTKAAQKIKSLGGDTIGNGAPVPTEAPRPVDPSNPSNPSNPLNAINAGYFATLAERSMHSIQSRMSQARTPTQIQNLQDTAERAMYNALQSGNKDLIASLTSLKDELKKVEAGIRGSGGGAGSPPVPPAPGDAAGGNWFQRLMGSLRGGMNGAGPWLQGQGANTALGGLTNVLGGPVGSALFAGAGRFLTGPIGIGLGLASAANYAFNAVSNTVKEGNAPARNEVLGYADLARQYGSSKNFMGIFRDAGGWTNDRFARLGFSATQAAHAAAVYDRPGGMTNDVESILQFSRATGTEDSRVASIANQVGRAGVGGTLGGNADQVLRTFKMAMTEGVKLGIAQSETMNSLSGAVQRNSSQGAQTNSTALAYFANISRRLNSNGEMSNPLMRGERGLNVMQGFMQGLGDGGGDAGVQWMLTSSLIKKGLPSAKAAGMVDDKGAISNEGNYYTALQHESPVMAAQYLMKRAGTGKNPQIMKFLSETIDQMSAGSVAQKTMLYKTLNPNASDEDIAALIGGDRLRVGGGLSNILGTSANGQALERYKAGENLKKDVQGNNTVANQTLLLRVAEQDRDMIKSLVNLKVTAGLEQALGKLANEVSNLRGRFSSMFGPMWQQGDLSGTTGQGWKNPSYVRPEATTTAASNGQAVETPITPSVGGRVGGGISARSRVLAAVAMSESTNGRNVVNGSLEDGARGLFQMRGKYLIGEHGWAKEAGVTMQNPDGSAVTTAAQANAWQMANPAAANRMAAGRLLNVEKQIRARAKAEGVTLSDGQVAGYVGLVWHANGGDNLSPVLKNGKLIVNPVGLSQADRGDGQSDYNTFNKVSGIYTSPSLRAANVGYDDGMDPRIAPDGEDVHFTQDYGEHPNNEQGLGYDERGHLGWDLRIGRAGVGGEAVHSRVPGKVVQAGANKGWGGNTVTVLMENGYKVLHGHLGKVSVKAGDMVSTQTVIGAEGTSGLKKGSAPHLHVEVYDPEGHVTNPANLFGPADAKIGGQIKGYRQGGYTGHGDRGTIAGVVHGQEFVMTADATARYRPQLEAMNAGGGSSTVNVNLGGTLQINASLSPAAERAVHDEYDRFQERAGRIISADVQNARGVRG